VDGVDATELVESPEGFTYFSGLLPPERLTLIRPDIEPVIEPEASESMPDFRPTDAYSVMGTFRKKPRPNAEPEPS
jgi:hypothetical protein